MRRLPPARPAPPAPLVPLVHAALLLLVPPLGGQVPEDASVLPRGTLRVTLDPQRVFWSERLTVNGTRERWSADFERDPFGSQTVPSLERHEQALRSLTGLPSLSFSLGASTLDAEADGRGTPLRAELGLTSRLTVGISVPLVRTQVKATFSLDTTGATVGWNPTLPQAADPAGLAAYQALFAQIEAAAAELEANIAAGMYGCPTSSTCLDAQSLVQRSRAFSTDLNAVVFGTAMAPPSPVMPRQGSEGALALSGSVVALQAEFASFGIASFTQSPTYPAEPLSAEDFDELITDPALGIAALPLTSASRWTLGDVALSAKYLLRDRPRFRAAVAAVVRLPTGTLDDPDHFLDLAGGDHQLDLEGRLHADLRPFDELTVGFAARYALQRSASLIRRVTPHDRPIGDLTTRREVERDLGDVFELSMAPAVILTPELDVYALGMYRHKGADRVTESGPVSAPPFPANALELDTDESAWRFGGGVRYRVTGRFETGLTYLSTFRGSGGLTPAVSFTAVSVRLYFGLFERPVAPAPAPPS